MNAKSPSVSVGLHLWRASHTLSHYDYSDIEIEVETFMDENPIKMSVGEHLLYNGTYPEVNIYDCMDSHDKRIIEEIFKIVSNYNLTENTGEE